MRGRVLLFVVVMLGVLTAAGTASAKRHHRFQGKPSGVLVKKGTVSIPRGRPAAQLGPRGLAPLVVSCPQPQPDPACNLTYHNGPVEHTNTTHIVYWLPTGFSFQANYQSVLERYMTDVAADSGRVSNPYAIATQYSDTTNGNILYSSTYAGTVTDTDAFPAPNSGCALQGTATVCVTQTQETKELDAFIKANSLPRSINDIYFLVLPQNVQTCFDDFSDCGPYGGVTDSMGNTSEYCAYHSSFDAGNGLTIWANMPDGADGGCNVVPNAPNNSAADTLIDSLSHEHNETITNPVSGGWFDVDNTGEEADKCNFSFGPSLGSTTNGSYDVLINHNPYEIQSEWDNSITGCGMTFGAVDPTAAFSSSPPSPKALDSVSFDGSGSHSNDTGGYIIKYSWDFGDGGTSESTTSSSATHSYASSGTYPVELTVTDDAGKTASVSNDVTVVTRPTTTTYTGATTGDYHDPVTLSGNLIDNGTSTGVANRQIKFTVGAKSCTGTTDSSGAASCSVTLGDIAGPYTAKADFTGDSAYTASSDSASFTVTPEETTMTYTGPVVILASASGATLTATLVEDGANDTDGDGGSAAPDPPQSVTLSLGSQSCMGSTDSSGNVSCTIAPVNAALGSQTVGASFVGNGYYQPSSASTTAIVFAFPSRGAFLLGDRTVAAATPTTTVTWWSNSWSSLNSLSGGPAPPAGKGFANTVSLPTSTPPAKCGGNWSTSGGNSPPPTTGVPSYMGVLVTSKATKNGSTIAGNTVHIVVVKTSPGYGPDPSRQGKGVIVATYC